MGIAVVLTALSFWQPAGGASKGPTAKLAVQTLSAAPLDALAPLMAQEPQALRQRLAERGLQIPPGQTSVTEIAKVNGKEPMQVLAAVLEKPAAR